MCVGLPSFRYASVGIATLSDFYFYPKERNWNTCHIHILLWMESLWIDRAFDECGERKWKARRDYGMRKHVSHVNWSFFFLYFMNKEFTVITSSVFTSHAIFPTFLHFDEIANAVIPFLVSKKSIRRNELGVRWIVARVTGNKCNGECTHGILIAIRARSRWME